MSIIAALLVLVVLLVVVVAYVRGLSSGCPLTWMYSAEITSAIGTMTAAIIKAVFGGEE